MNPIEMLRLEGASLSIGEATRKFPCPWCGHNETGNVLRRVEGGLRYRCYHATCEVSGRRVFVPSYGNYTYKSKKTADKRKEYNTILWPVEGELLDKLLSEVKLTAEEVAKHGIMYNPERDTYAYPMFDRYGRKIGIVDRSYVGRVPKAITYPYTNDALIHFVPGDKASGPILVTEDIPSSICVSRYARAASMCGSSLTRDMVAKLLEVTSDIILWMDDDVWMPPKKVHRKWRPMPVQYKAEYGFLFDSFEFIRTKEDPKDMKPDELEGVINAALNNT